MNRRIRKKKNCPYIQLKKLKPDELALFQMDMDDDNFDIDVAVNFVTDFVTAISKNKIFSTKAYVLLPKYLNVQFLDKEFFRKCLDMAEEVYEKL